MEKVKLPLEVADAIDTIRRAGMSEHGLYDINWLESDVDDNNQIRLAKDSICEYIESSTDQFDPDNPLIKYYKALVVGYVRKKTVHDLFYSDEHIEYKKGVLDTLHALDIKIEGVNA